MEISLKCILFFIFAISTVKSVPLFAPSKIDEVLELSPKYMIAWSIDKGSEKITFELTVETKGFIGFGLSPTGGMQAADMIIGGVSENGTVYFTDRHGMKGDSIVDEVQNWELISAEETETHTILKVSRLLNTCDAQDIEITKDTAKLIWSFGERDEVQYHGRDTRGTKSINLLFPPAQADLSGYKRWNLTATTKIPKSDTTYWCTFHKTPPKPPTSNKLHIVGWDVISLTDEAAKYTHHVEIKRCLAPPNTDPEEMFGNFVGKEGVACYEDPGDYPIRHCESYVISWAVGRGLTLLPDHVGYEITDTSADSVFYMLEVHYDNPTLDEVAEFTTGLQLYYTETPREVDAGLLGLGHYNIFTLSVPPNTDGFVISGHCPSECTNYFPEEGLTLFNTLLHSHLSGRKIKLRQFRDGKELPWVQSDNNFDFNYQENKPVDVKLFPGDSFTTECTYSTTWKNGSAVVAGLGSRDEMCLSWLWYYPKIEMEFCYSFYPVQKNMADFGIQNFTWGGSPFSPLPTILSPPEMYGKSYQEVMNKFVDWTPDKINKMQEDHRYGDHNYFCFSAKSGVFPVNSTSTKYVTVEKEYVPENTCSGNSNSNILRFNSKFVWPYLGIYLSYVFLQCFSFTHFVN